MRSCDQVIKDYKLIVIVNLLLVIDVIILITWQVIDPPFQTKKELPHQVSLCITHANLFGRCATRARTALSQSHLIDVPSVLAGDINSAGESVSLTHRHAVMWSRGHVE